MSRCSDTRETPSSSCAYSADARTIPTAGEAPKASGYAFPSPAVAEITNLGGWFGGQAVRVWVGGLGWGLGCKGLG